MRNTPYLRGKLIVVSSFTVMSSLLHAQTTGDWQHYAIQDKEGAIQCMVATQASPRPPVSALLRFAQPQTFSLSADVLHITLRGLTSAVATVNLSIDGKSVATLYRSEQLSQGADQLFVLPMNQLRSVLSQLQKGSRAAVQVNDGTSFLLPISLRGSSASLKLQSQCQQAEAAGFSLKLIDLIAQPGPTVAVPGSVDEMLAKTIEARAVLNELSAAAKSLREAQQAQLAAQQAVQRLTTAKSSTLTKLQTIKTDIASRDPAKLQSTQTSLQAELSQTQSELAQVELAIKDHLVKVTPIDARIRTIRDRIADLQKQEQALQANSKRRQELLAKINSSEDQIVTLENEIYELQDEYQRIAYLLNRDANGYRKFGGKDRPSNRRSSGDHATSSDDGSDDSVADQYDQELFVELRDPAVRKRVNRYLRNNDSYLKSKQRLAENLAELKKWQGWLEDSQKQGNQENIIKSQRKVKEKSSFVELNRSDIRQMFREAAERAISEVEYLRGRLDIGIERDIRTKLRTINQLEDQILRINDELANSTAANQGQGAVLRSQQQQENQRLTVAQNEKRQLLSQETYLKQTREKAALETKISQLRAALQSLKQKATSSPAELSRLNAEQSSLEGQLAKIESDLNQANAALLQNQAGASDLMKNAEQQEARVREQQDRLQALINEIRGIAVYLGIPK